jgi:hypothetical protein
MLCLVRLLAISNCVNSLTYYSALYSKDWCCQHPDGTIGEFYRHFDSVDPKILEVCYLFT